MRTGPGTAVVTGAGSGLGREIGRALLDDGWRVALAGRREDALVETAGASPHALVVPTDVADGDAVSALFRTVTDAWGRLDLLVNNAGTTGPVRYMVGLPLDTNVPFLTVMATTMPYLGRG